MSLIVSLLHVSGSRSVPSVMKVGRCHVQEVGAEVVLYTTATAAVLPAPTNLLIELRFQAGVPGIKVTVRSDRTDISALLFPALSAVLAS